MMEVRMTVERTVLVMKVRGARVDAGDTGRVYLSSHDSSDLVYKGLAQGLVLKLEG